MKTKMNKLALRALKWFKRGYSYREINFKLFGTYGTKAYWLLNEYPQR